MGIEEYYWLYKIVIQLLNFRPIGHGVQAGESKKGRQLKVTTSTFRSVQPGKALGSLSLISVCFSLLFL